MFYDKFSELCKKNGVSASSVCDSLNLSRGVLARWKSGSSPRNATLKLIAEYFSVPIGYFGEEEIPEAIPVKTIDMIPIYGNVSAGSGVLAEDQIVGYEPAFDVAHPNEYFYLRVHGDSMKPRLLDGDTVLCHKQESVEPGEIAVLLVDGEDGVVKRVDYDEGSITLLSFNPFYPPRVFEGPDVRRVSVLAKVVMMMRRF